MILRLSDSFSRGLIVAVALGVTASLSFFAVRMAFAENGADEGSAKGLQRATRLEPKNPDYWYRLGHYQQFNLEQPDSSESQRSLKKAIELDPKFTDAWLDLGTTHELDGNLDAAREAYEAAKKSYPTSAEVSWRYGNFLLRQGDVQAAYPEFRRSLEIDPRRAAAAFSRCFRANPDIDQIMDNVLPPLPGVYADVVTEAASANQIAVAEIMWKRLLTLHPRLNIRDVEPLVAILLSQGDDAGAKKIWDEGTAVMYLPPLLSPTGSVVWDASFESGLSLGTFAWHFAPIAQGVTTAFDTSEKLSGNQSLRLGFDGKHNPSIEAACAVVIVAPNTNYHFSSWIKTKDLTTSHGVGFHIHSYNRSRLESPVVSSRTISGTTPWTFVDLPYQTGPDAARAAVCVNRERDLDSDVRISGTAWIDDVNLVPASAEQPKP